LSVNTNLLKNKNITVYPNPTHNEVYIVGANSLKKLEIYNAVGQLVRTIKPALYKNTTTIDMSSLKEGVYFLKSEKQVIKIIKK